MASRTAASIDVGAQRGAADRLPAARSACLPFAAFLSTAISSISRSRSQRRPRHRQPGALEQVAHPADFSFFQLTRLAKTAPRPSPCRRRPPRRAARSPYPAPASIAWPKVWPKLSSARAARLALVLGDDARLELAAAAHGVGQRAALARAESFPHWPSSQSTNAASSAKPCLITSASPARSSRSGSVSSVATSEITAQRLVEGADHVLAARMVDRGLAADRRVDLREQRGRHLHESDAALVDRGGEAGQVADHAAAQGDDQAVAPAARGEQGVEHLLHALPALRLLAVGNHDLGNARAFQRRCAFFRR